MNISGRHQFPIYRSHMATNQKVRAVGKYQIDNAVCSWRIFER